MPDHFTIMSLSCDNHNNPQPMATLELYTIHKVYPSLTICLFHVILSNLMTFYVLCNLCSMFQCVGYVLGLLFNFFLLLTFTNSLLAVIGVAAKSVLQTQLFCVCSFLLTNNLLIKLLLNSTILFESWDEQSVVHLLRHG